jgi:hypothetical protein
MVLRIVANATNENKPDRYGLPLVLKAAALAAAVVFPQAMQAKELAL